MAHTLTWMVPVTFTDCSALDPYREIQCYQIACSDNGVFTDNEIVAELAGVDNGVLTERFDLTLLYPYGLTGGIVSVRAVSWDNQQSAFAAPVPWNRMEE